MTGCAGWMFRAVVEYFAGIRPGYRGFSVHPCLPSTWDRVTVRRPLRGKAREIAVRRSGGGYSVEVDGVSVGDTEVGY